MADKKRFVRDPMRVRKPLPNQIGFKFKKEVSVKRKKIVLKNICSWKEVETVEQVFKDTGVDLSDSMINLYILFVKKSIQIEAILKKLQSLPEIEYAYLPPTRGPLSAG